MDFTYNYPYTGFGETARFQTQWSENRKKLNGSYTYPMVFNEAVPMCSHIKVDIEIENTGSVNIFGRVWDFMVNRKNYGWSEILSFTMPDDGIYTIDCDIPNYTITEFAIVPSTNPGTSASWSSWFYVDELTITETMELQELETGKFQYGVFVNKSGVSKQINEVYVNISGSLVPATGILVNVNDELVPIQNVYSYHYVTEKESMALFAFTPETDGKYKIQVKRVSGDHELRFYSSDFEELYDGFFYDRSFGLTAGTLYYITLTHYYSAEASESYLQIYREE